MRSRMKPAAAVCLSLALFACSRPPASTDARLDALSGDALVASRFVGNWLGHIEQLLFPSGSDAIALTVAREASTGQLSGVLVFGKGEPPKQFDPDVGYPQNGDIDFVQEGFRFHLRGATATGDRLTFVIVRAEQWTTWCELQSTYKDDANPGNYYWCLPNWGVTGDGDGNCYQVDPTTSVKHRVDCGKLTLCSPPGVCACISTGCTASEGLLAPFDLALWQDIRLNGSVRLLGAERPVRLDRM